VFDAKGEYHSGRPAEIKIGDSIVMLSDGDELRDSATALLFVYVVVSLTNLAEPVLYCEAQPINLVVLHWTAVGNWAANQI